MKLYFTENQKENSLNEFELEDASFKASWIEGSEKSYIMGGTAVIDGESYSDFEIEFETINEPESYTIESILEEEWDWYDYKFD